VTQNYAYEKHMNRFHVQFQALQDLASHEKEKEKKGKSI